MLSVAKYPDFASPRAQMPVSKIFIAYECDLLSHISSHFLFLPASADDAQLMRMFQQTLGK